MAAERLLSASSSEARLNTPADRLVEPPVMEPPRLITWPSSVTIRKHCVTPGHGNAQSRSSTITVLPSKLRKICPYCASNRTKREATPTKPNSDSTPG